MTNAELFMKTFGIHSEEFWSYTEKQMLDWINADVPDTNVGDTMLKPCPFCGGKAKIEATTTMTHPNHCKHYCYCEKCLATGQSFSDYDNDGSSVFRAIEAWNRRSDEKR